MRILPPDPGLLIVSCDGAARGNPGPAGIGVQITDEAGNVLAEIAEWIGETTNNVAEYTAALEGLRKAADLGARRVHLRSDSKLLIEQLAGRYKVKASHLRPLHAEVVGLMLGLRARAPPARPQGAEPRGRSAREPRRGPQGIGLGEPLTIPSGWIRPCKGNLQRRGAAGPSERHPHGEAVGGGLCGERHDPLDRTARRQGAERGRDLSRAWPPGSRPRPAGRRPWTRAPPRGRSRPAGRTASRGPRRTHRWRGRSRLPTSFPASRRSRTPG